MLVGRGKSLEEGRNICALPAGLRRPILGLDRGNSLREPFHYVVIL